MRVALESGRSLLYATARWVDLQTQLDERLAKLKADGKKPTGDERARAKEAGRITGLLTPLSKYLLSESANRIAHDALQIHGGAGYMTEFVVERLVRDARITNIYEGTSQMQIVAAIGGVMRDTLGDFFASREEKRRIARVAAGLVEEGGTVILDGGSTVAAVAQELVGRSLHILTNSIPIAEILGDSRKVELT